jgi:hypothetical protein
MASGGGRRRSRRQQAPLEFPYGDFKNVHRCAVLAAESRAGQYTHTAIEYVAIERAAAHLHGMLDALMASKPFVEKRHVPSV